MALDPNIPLSFRPPQIADPMQTAMQFEQHRAVQEQRQAIADQRRAQTEAAQRQAEEDAAIQTVFQTKPLEQIKPSDLYGVVNPKRAGEIWKGIQDMRTSDFKSDEEVRKSMLTRIGAIRALPEASRPGAYDVVVQDYVRRGLIDAAQVKPYSPDVLDAYEFELLTPEQREKRAQGTTHSVGGALVNVKPGEQPNVLYQAAEKPPQVGSFEDYVVRKHGPNPTPEQIAEARKAYQQADDRPYRDPVPVVVVTADGPQLVDRRSGTASAITSADGKSVGLAPTATQRDREASMSRAQPVLDSIAELSEKINTNQGVYAKMAGGASKVAAKANLDDDVAEYTALVQMFTPLLARMVGHVGILTEQDVQSVRAGLPQPGDSKSVRDRKIKRIKTILGAQAGDGNAPPSTPPAAGGVPTYQDYLKRRKGGG